MKQFYSEEDAYMKILIKAAFSKSNPNCHLYECVSETGDGQPAAAAAASRRH